MGALFIFILISVLVIAALLFFNKGVKAQEIKSILTDIYENLKELFSNFKKLFLILKDLIQTNLDPEPTQPKSKSSSENSPKSIFSNKSISISSEESESPSEDSSDDSSETEAKTETLSNPKIISNNELDATSDDSINKKDT